MRDFNAPVLTELLSLEEMNLISSLAVRRSYRAGEMIHDRGDQPAYMGVVVGGAVRLVSPRHDGREIYLTRVNAGQNFGDMTLPFGKSCVHRALAIEDTQVDRITGTAFAQIVEQPNIAFALYKVAAFRLALTMEMLDDMRTLPADALVAKLLLSFHENMDQPGALDFVQENLASYLGVSLVTLNKALRSLKHAGLVENGLSAAQDHRSGKAAPVADSQSSRLGKRPASLSGVDQFRIDFASAVLDEHEPVLRIAAHKPVDQVFHGCPVFIFGGQGNAQ